MDPTPAPAPVDPTPAVPIPPPAPPLTPLNPMMQQFMTAAISGVGTLVRRLAIVAVGAAVSHQWVTGEWTDMLVTLLAGALLSGLEYVIFNLRSRGSATLQEMINNYVGAPVLKKDSWVDYNTVTQVQNLLPNK